MAVLRHLALALAFVPGAAAAQAPQSPPAILEPAAYALPLAATFLPHLGIAHSGDAAQGRIVVLGESGTTSFRVLDGRMPAGVDIAPDGNLSGTYSEAGRHVARVRAMTGDGRKVDVDVVVDVAPRVALQAAGAAIP